MHDIVVTVPRERLVPTTIADLALLTLFTDSDGDLCLKVNEGQHVLLACGLLRAHGLAASIYPQTIIGRLVVTLGD